MNYDAYERERRIESVLEVVTRVRWRRESERERGQEEGKNGSQRYVVARAREVAVEGKNVAHC